MKKIIASFLIILSIGALSGCTTGEQQAAAIGGGALAGGVAGNLLTNGSPAGTIAGAGIGAFAGYAATQY